jgi:hypothetical protein
VLFLHAYANPDTDAHTDSNACSNSNSNTNFWNSAYSLNQWRISRRVHQTSLRRRTGCRDHRPGFGRHAYNHLSEIRSTQRHTDANTDGDSNANCYGKRFDVVRNFKFCR